LATSATIASAVDPAGPSNPLLTETVREGGAWLNNYAAHPWMIGPGAGLWRRAGASFGLRPTPKP
jgi:cytochrome d ubiquinol oxidase subunit II